MVMSLFILAFFTIVSFNVSAQENVVIPELDSQISEAVTDENGENVPEDEIKNEISEDTKDISEALKNQEAASDLEKQDLSNIKAFEEELAENMEEKVAVWTVEDVEKLNQAGFDFNLKDFKKNPVLYYALSRNNSSDVIEKIVEYGADVNEYAGNGMLPFNVVTSKANELQLQVLMMQTMGLDMSDPKVEDELKTRVFREMSRMLSLAAFLIDNGADVNKESVLGTPLMNAVTNKWNVEIINLLIKYGADVNKKDKNGRTALFYAFLSGNDEIVTQLIQYGADTDIKDNNGQTYLEVEKIN